MVRRSGNGQAAVAAGHALTADAAAEVLAAGGNAVDGAIAALWMACACEPVLASPGGGGFATILIDGKPCVLDFFVDAPGHKRPLEAIEFAEVHADFGTTTQAFHVGAGASAVPGFMPGLFAMHERYGSIPMRELAGPAFIAARDGVSVNAFQSRLFNVVGPILTYTPEAARLFGKTDETKDVFAEGAVMRNGALADALDALAREGERLITHGEIATAMIAQCDSHGGHLSRADLETFEVVWREPLAARIGGLSLAINPPPALGGALVAAMCAGLAVADEATHPLLLARAIDTVDRFWREAPQDAGRLVGRAGSQGGHVASRGTTQVSIIDGQANAVAVTVSNGEGNGRLVSDCGFMINNMLGEEDVNPGGFHAWIPGERLASMMAPGIARGPGGDVLALGSGGSNRIRTAILQVLANVALRELPLADAVAAPRLHVEKGYLDFEDLAVEGLFGEAERAALVAAFEDHTAWPEPSMYYGGVHAALRDASGAVSAAGDARRAGVGRTVSGEIKPGSSRR